MALPGRVAGHLLNATLALGLGTLASVVMLQVVARYMLNAPPFWTEELARFLLIWLTFLGAVAAHREGEHISVIWLSEQLGGRAARVVALRCHLLVLVVLAFIAKAGLDITRIGRQTSPALGISMGWFYVALPISAGLMMLVSVLRIWQTLHDLVRGRTQ